MEHNIFAVPIIELFFLFLYNIKWNVFEIECHLVESAAAAAAAVKSSLISVVKYLNV